MSCFICDDFFDELRHQPRDAGDDAISETLIRPERRENPGRLIVQQYCTEIGQAATRLDAL